MSVFDELYCVNVNEHTEQKNNLTYLSWAWAWAEVMKKYPSAQYRIRTFDGKPYLYDENLGYLVMTSWRLMELKEKCGCRLWMGQTRP